MNEAGYKQGGRESEKVKRHALLKNTTNGNVLAMGFFRRQTRLLVPIMVLILFYIHNRYAC